MSPVFNFVRRITPSKLRLCLASNSVNNCDNYRDNIAGVDVKKEVFYALEMNAYCLLWTSDYIINDTIKSSIWAPGGTGARIFGDNYEARNKDASLLSLPRSISLSSIAFHSSQLAC